MNEIVLEGCLKDCKFFFDFEKFMVIFIFENYIYLLEVKNFFYFDCEFVFLMCVFICKL